MIIRCWMVILLGLMTAGSAIAQWMEHSPHYQQQQYFQQWAFTTEHQWDSLWQWVSLPVSQSSIHFPSNWRPKVMGWHPYWMGTRYRAYRYELLSTIAYFSYEVDPQTGDYKTVHYWKTTPLVSLAKSYGTKVVLCVTNFGGDNNRQLLTNPQARQRLIDSLVALVKLRQADGVNVDFELIPYPWLRDSLTQFLRALAERFHREIPGSEVSIALPPVDWYGVFDVAAYNEFLDYCVMMGYDYHWNGSRYAGPIAPLTAGSIWSPWCVERSVEAYLAKGLLPEKLWLGVPYYGREWPVADTIPPAQTIDRGTAYTYERIVTKLLPTAQRYWDEHSQTPYYNRTPNYQGWYDDTISLRLKYDFARRRQLGGIGIWALGYDGARPELWQLLEQWKILDADQQQLTLASVWKIRPVPEGLLLFPPSGMQYHSLSITIWTLEGRKVAERFIDRVSATIFVPLKRSSALTMGLVVIADTGGCVQRLIVCWR